MLSTQHCRGQMPHAKLLWAKEMLSMWGACRAHKDTLASMVEWEWVNLQKWIGCTTQADSEAVLDVFPADREFEDVFPADLSAELQVELEFEMKIPVKP
eukprot:187328-Rhodomonas_salina.1